MSRSRKSTSVKKAKEVFKINATTIFKVPAGLEKKGNFLVWKAHPWLKKLPAVGKEAFQVEARRVLSEKGSQRPSVLRRARELQQKSDTKDIGQRTRGWSIVFPQTGEQREALALVSPESFLVYELVHPKTWAPGTWKVLPKFPITQRLPLTMQEKILKGSRKSVKVKIDPRGLNAAYNRARQHQRKYGEKLIKLILALQKKTETTSFTG